MNCVVIHTYYMYAVCAIGYRGLHGACHDETLGHGRFCFCCCAIVRHFLSAVAYDTRYDVAPWRRQGERGDNHETWVVRGLVEVVGAPRVDTAVSVIHCVRDNVLTLDPASSERPI